MGSDLHCEKYDWNSLWSFFACAFNYVYDVYCSFKNLLDYRLLKEVILLFTLSFYLVFMDYYLAIPVYNFFSNSAAYLPDTLFQNNVYAK